MSKKSTSDRVHLFAIQNKGDGSLKHAIEDIINMAEGITILSRKQTPFLFFLSLSVFYNMFMLYWSSRVNLSEIVYVS